MNTHPIGEQTTKSETAAIPSLSQGLEELVRELGNRDLAKETDPYFDVLIIGSGYGGALAADELAGAVDPKTRAPIRVCVLERGRESERRHSCRRPGVSRPRTVGDCAVRRGPWTR